MTSEERLRAALEDLQEGLYGDPSPTLEYAEASIQKIFESPVREFHEVFGHPIAEKPTVPVYGLRELRVKLLLEEVLEFAAASGVRITVWDSENREVVVNDKTEFVAIAWDPVNIVEAADALADIRYVTDGAFLTWGLPDEALLREVHRSNMSKLGEDGNPIYREDGKVMKGPNFTLPDIAGVLKRYGWEG